MKRHASLALLVALGATLASVVVPSRAEPGDPIIVARLAGAVDPAGSRYVVAAIELAERRGAQAFILQLDTPGGLDSSMREIVQAMRRVALPVVVYVAPPGARAASAGVFVAYAADVVAMAPATNIGAAHPVALGQELGDTEAQKATSDAVAYVRALAESTGRNGDWAADAVRQSASATAQEALSLKVADLMAQDLDDLLRQLDSRTVRKGNRSFQVATRGAQIEIIDMSWPERIVHALVNPSVTYLLLAVAVWALIAEFSAPGISVPGVIGLLSLVLFTVSASIIPINWAGAVLILAAIAFFIVDIKAPTHGVLTLGGIASFVVGSLLLFRPLGNLQPITLPQTQVWHPSWWLIVFVVGSTAAIFMVALALGLSAQRLAPVIGQRAVPGASGYVTSVHGTAGIGQSLTVQVRGELWSARSDLASDTLNVGDAVQVVRQEGLALIVRPKQKE